MSSYRNFQMRRLTFLSSFSSRRRAVSVSSIVQAKAFCYFVQRVGFLFAAPDTRQNTLGRVRVFQVFNVLQDRLAGVVGLRAASALGQSFKAFFDGLWKPDREHNLSLYEYSNPRCDSKRDALVFVRRGASPLCQRPAHAHAW